MTNEKRFRADGSLFRETSFRDNESIVWVKQYRVDGSVAKVSKFRGNGTMISQRTIGK